MTKRDRNRKKSVKVKSRREIAQDPERRKKLSESLRAYYSKHPERKIELREQLMARLTTTMNTAEYRKKVSEGMKAYLQKNPERKKRLIERLKLVTDNSPAALIKRGEFLRSWHANLTPEDRQRNNEAISIGKKRRNQQKKKQRRSDGVKKAWITRKQNIIERKKLEKLSS